MTTVDGATIRGSGGAAHAWLLRAGSILLSQRARWPLWLPVWFGIGIAGYFALPFEPAAGWAYLAVAVAGGCALLARLLHPALAMAAMCLLVAGGGFAAAQWRTAAVAAPVLAKRTPPIVVEGQVVQAEERTADRRVTLRLLRMGGHGGSSQPDIIRVTSRDRSTPLQPGAVVRLRAVLMPPPEPAIPGGYDFARAAWFDRLGAVGFALGSIDVLSADATDTTGLELRINAVRQQVSARIRAQLEGDSGAIAAALITGDRGGIPEPALAAIRHSGLAHLLAISGLHMGLIAGTLFFLVRGALALVPWLALRLPIKKCAAVAALAGAFGYLLLSGATVPTQRAFLMAALALAAVLLDRRPISMRLVAFAAAVILIWRPESLLSAGFQMSFAAVIGLVAAYEVLAPWFTAARRRGGIAARLIVYVAALAVTTIVAGAMTAPFALFGFHQIASYGLVGNLLAVPLMALVAMPAALLALIAMPFGLDGVPLAIMGVGIEAILWVAETVSAWPGAVRHVAAFPSVVLGAISLGGLWLCVWRGRLRLLGLPVIAAGLALMLSGRPYDLLVSGDGSALLASDTGRTELAGNGSRRAVRTWLEASGWPPEAEPAKADRCDGVGCVFVVQGRTVAFARDGRALVDDCREADIVIAAVPVRRLCRGPELVIDRFDLWRNGAHGLRFSATGVQVDTVAAARGLRPWSPRRSSGQ